MCPRHLRHLRQQLPATAALVALYGAVALGVAVQAADADTPPPPPAGSLINTLGLQPAPQPVRERPGWHAPHLILVSDQLHEVLPQLQAVAPGVRFVAISAATPRDVASADATLGVCTADVLAKAKKLEWIQSLGAGVERCVQQPAVRERQLLLTNMQRAAGPSMAEHVLGMMLVLSRHLDYYLEQQHQGHWADESPQLTQR